MSNTNTPKRRFITVSTPEPAPAKPSPKKGGWDSPIPAEEFIAAWQTSSSVSEVARKLDATEGAIQQRARQYIKRGIKLKLYPRRKSAARPQLDVDALNQLIDQLGMRGDDK